MSIVSWHCVLFITQIKLGANIPIVSVTVKHGELRWSGWEGRKSGRYIKFPHLGVAAVDSCLLGQGPYGDQIASGK